MAIVKLNSISVKILESKSANLLVFNTVQATF